ncbi:MAG: potassium channel family protein [bacterium]|nr:potassium channel family protein [bacterium]
MLRKSISEFINNLCFWVVSPTRLLADIAKASYGHYKGYPGVTAEQKARKAEARAYILIKSNLIYRIVSWSIIIFFIIKDFPPGVYCLLRPVSNPFWFWAIASYCVSRSCEIIIAFCRDSLRIIHGLQPTSALTPSDRIMMAIHSYICIIIDFSVLYRVLGRNHIDGINNIFDAAYFSVITIATVGYGDIKPISYWGKFITGFEVFCGMALVVLTLTTYLGQCQTPQRRDQ